MAQRAIVTITKPDQKRLVRASGVEVIGDYTDSLLVRGEKPQLDELRKQQVEIDELEDAPLRTGRAEFSMRDALAADRVAPVPTRPNRKNYYLLQLAGPPTKEWLHEIRGAGASVQDSFAADTLLVG